MFKGAHDIFALMIKFLKAYYQSKHITLGLFKNHRYYWTNFNHKFDWVVAQYDMKRNFFCLCEGWGVNLNILIATWKLVINYEILSLGESFQGTCFGHDFSKACQYDVQWMKKITKVWSMCLSSLHKGSS
jgi:hypothetical protein